MSFHAEKKYSSTSKFVPVRAIEDIMHQYHIFKNHFKFFNCTSSQKPSTQNTKKLKSLTSNPNREKEGGQIMKSKQKTSHRPVKIEQNISPKIKMKQKTSPKIKMKQKLSPKIKSKPQQIKTQEKLSQQIKKEILSQTSVKKKP
eukprot:UN00653